MNTDCAFYIGTTHEICQDYALAGKSSVTVADGCSGSNHSDMGSRILSITAMNKIAELDSLYNFDEKECILSARPAIKILNMPNECLDATLLAAVSYEKDDELMAMCCGDGVIVIGTKEKETIIINCAYTDSYPFYMNYLYDRTGRYSNWLKNYNNREITQTVIGVDGKIISTTIISSYNVGRLFGNLSIIKPYDNKIIIEMSEASKLIEYIAVMSDGVHSFYETVITDTSKYNKSVPYIDVLKELLDFKNFNQAFVQRRVNKFRKNCAKKNWGNADDLSLAVIYTGK